MTDWQDISTAPKDGERFLALNYNGELHVAAFIDGERLAYRTHQMNSPTSHILEKLEGGRKGWVREDGFTEKHERWDNSWSYWQRGYEFKPTHFLSLPSPPTDLAERIKD